MESLTFVPRAGGNITHRQDDIPDSESLGTLSLEGAVGERAAA